MSHQNEVLKPSEYLKDYRKKISHNLIQLMEECKVTLSELHRNTGVPIATIQRIKSEPDSNPTISTLKPIADFFSISISQLIGDEPLPNKRLIGVYVENRENWIRVPLISFAQAIVWPNLASIDSKFPTVTTDINIGGNSFAVIVDEEGLNGIQFGSVIIVDPNLNPKNKDYVLVHKIGSPEATIKKYILYDGVEYLSPLNHTFKTVQNDEEFRILGVIVQIRMDTRK